MSKPTTPCPKGGPDHKSGVVGRKTCAVCDYGMVDKPSKV